MIYLDPDILVYGSLQPIFSRLDRHPVVPTPHTTTPVDNDNLPGELEFLNSGIYNLGFAAYNALPDAPGLLDWWERRCLQLAYNDQPCDLFVDQKWMDFAPSLCADVCVPREQAFNVAYRNLHERTVRVENGKPFVGAASLVFFHFSGLPRRGDDRISKYQTPFTLRSLPDIAPLFARYRDTLEGNGHAGYLKRPYGFGQFSDGTPITALARRTVIDHPLLITETDPFNAAGPLCATLTRARLLTVKTATDAPSSGGVSGEAARLQRLVGFAFLLFLHVLGAAHYEHLMRCFVSVSSLRAQTFLIDG